MKIALVALATVPQQLDAAASPVGKVLSMISDLEQTIIKEGEAVQTEYSEFAEWCEDRSRNIGFEVKTGKSDVENLQAAIKEETATIESLETKVEELAAAISTDDAELKAAMKIREKENAIFVAEEKELMETISMLQRATDIIEREMKGGASMLQLQGTDSVVKALEVMVQASLINTEDASKLSAFVQTASNAQDSDSDETAGAPAAAAYQSQSGGIIDALGDLQGKAEGQLDAARKKETTSKNNFEMLEANLNDKLKYAKEDMDEAKKGIAASSEKKSTAEGDLQVTSKELAEDVKSKEALHHDCMTRAEAFESETKSRSEELKALATAKKIIKEAMSGAALTQVSLVQVASTSTGSKSLEVVHMIRDLARKEKSTALAQLASRMTTAMHSGNDVFGKVKGLISDMIGKLEKAAEADATKKAYCDKELSETNGKKTDKTDEIEGLTTKIDQGSAKVEKLKEQVAVLESQLAKIAKSQAEIDKLRKEEKTVFDRAKAELDKGLAGIKKALKVLNDYYAKDGKSHDSSDGASSGIIGLLEVVEEDLTKDLAEITSEEESAVAEYTAVSNENEIDRTTKEQDVKYKTKEIKGLDKTGSELTADRTGVKEELDAVNEYLSRIEEECIAKAETYEERKKRREAELAGLKEGLDILESETSLVQDHSTRRTFRR